MPTLLVLMRSTMTRINLRYIGPIHMDMKVHIVLGHVSHLGDKEQQQPMKVQGLRTFMKQHRPKFTCELGNGA